ncbi:hypothetical protein H310_04562 [Aphanomyces invadans]|uniref:Tetratricopeptide SHNi-TPR domain-containing protein n=1 Tax=Aphanomyces invadans TaxID=157072 RepID=A0A024UD81_9STRA|nr:hypothetical protein H310_04562 [Aphanomyces invadans]ETW04224.1 hypothetical protein H310_04562 [Aphanomyces invadans]|eukprot:XP_008867180.1 hypothetical protein H310_04562 [Aphanomyces invadans]
MTVSPTKHGQGGGDASSAHGSAIQTSKEIALEAAKTRCESHMIAKDFQRAYATIVECIKDAVGVYGKSSLQLVPYYLCMAEVGLELSHMNQVEEVLALCTWNIVKAAEDDAANEPKTLVHRAVVCKLFGRYHCECEQFDEAVKQAANGAYYAALVHGPEDIRTSTLYFTLGAIFQKMFRTEEALGMYDKVVEIWYKHLAVVTRRSRPSHDDDDGDSHDHVATASPGSPSPQSERIYHEGNAMLAQVLTTRAKILGEAHIATGEVQYTVGLLRLYMNDKDLAKAAIDKALAIYTDALVRATDPT